MLISLTSIWFLKNQKTMDKLVGPNPRDVLILEVEAMKKEQRILREKEVEKQRQEQLANAKEYENKIIEKRKKVCEYAFYKLAKRYLKLEDQFLSRLSGDKQKIRELEKIVFIKAKRSLWWKMPLAIIFGLVVPIFGWIPLVRSLIKSNPSFASYKFVALYAWYLKNFGPIPLVKHSWLYD